MRASQIEADMGGCGSRSNSSNLKGHFDQSRFETNRAISIMRRLGISDPGEAIDLHDAIRDFSAQFGSEAIRKAQQNPEDGFGSADREEVLEDEGGQIVRSGHSKVCRAFVDRNNHECAFLLPTRTRGFSEWWEGVSIPSTRVPMPCPLYQIVYT